MKVFEFEKYFPSEESCKAKFKKIRERGGIICPKCGCPKHYWKTDKEVYQCKKCNYRQSLKANTVMHSSKLPFKYWFIAMHLLTATKQSFSAAELQRQLEHSRYQPIWELLHKLRSSMGKRNNKYTLSGNVELDEGFFTTETPSELKGKRLKAGAGSQRKAKVVIMAETEVSETVKRGQKPTKVKHIKMVVVGNLKADTIGDVAEDNIESTSKIITDGSKSHKHFKTLFKEHQSQVINPKDIGKVLPWVHIAISNSKTLLRGIHYGIKPEYLQGYLNEFCYKFNRRYFGEGMFDRLMVVSANYRSDFQHRTYRKAA
jgi:DNA-directed RNA polymerase subunit RPC12/RpoP